MKIMTYLSMALSLASPTEMTTTLLIKILNLQGRMKKTKPIEAFLPKTVKAPREAEKWGPF